MSTARSGVSREAWGGRVAVGLVALVALAVRLPGHLDSGMWFDEIWRLLDVRHASLASVIIDYPGDRNHPLHDLLGWFALRAFGDSTWAWRLTALVAGASSVAMLLVYARKVTRADEAWLATALAATSYHHVWFSQNARGYTLLLLLTLASTALWEELDGPGVSRSAIVGYAVVTALAVYTHPSAAVLAAGHLAGSAVRRWRGDGDARARSWRPVLVGISAAGALSLALYLPKLGEMSTYLVTKSVGGNAGVEVAARTPVAWTSLRWAIEAAARSLGVGLAAGLIAVAAAAIVLLVGAVSYAREAPGRLMAWSAPGLLIAGAMAALGRSLWPRLLFFLAGFGLLVLARGAVVLIEMLTPRRWPRRPVKTAALCGIWLASTSLLPRAYTLPKQDFEGARNDLAARAGPGDAVATVGLAIDPYRYYATGYTPVTSVADLAALERRSRTVFVVSTLPEYFNSRYPELAAILSARGREVARYHGSVVDGDVVIYRLTPGVVGARP